MLEAMPLAAALAACPAAGLALRSRPSIRTIEGVRRVAPTEIKVLSTTAMKTVFEALAGDFERATGRRLNVTLGPSLRLEKQLGDGEAADVAIVPASRARALV